MKTKPGVGYVHKERHALSQDDAARPRLRDKSRGLPSTKPSIAESRVPHSQSGYPQREGGRCDVRLGRPPKFVERLAWVPRRSTAAPR